jgi:thiamine pyrophosphokinase
MPRTVLILAGGTAPTSDVTRALDPAAMCIAADSGLDHARALGLVPDLVIGDLDSVTPAALAWAELRGVPIERHPTDKAQTDLELALSRAVDLDPVRVVVAGIGGGRLDHFLANVAVLADRRWSAVAVDGLIDGATISVIHGERTLQGQIGDLVSLLPVHGDALGVTTIGLRWPLQAATLTAGTSWGVSNVFTAATATVSLHHGTLLAVQPGAADGAGGSAGPAR